MKDLLWHAGLLFLLILQNAGASRANPMRQIISMLQDMKTELEREGDVEKEVFEKALCACETGEKNLQNAVGESTAAIDEWSSKTQAGTAESAQLAQEVADHKASKATAEEDLEQATALRKKDHKAFTEEERSNKINLKQLGAAIPALEKGMSGAMLMQMRGAGRLRRMIEITKFLTSDERSGVLAFLEQGSNDEELAGSSVQAPSSGEILGILKSMRDEMQRDLSEIQKQEQSDAQAFSDMKIAKMEEIDVAAKAVVDKEKRIGALAVSISEGKHALGDSQEELANAQKFLANLQEECAKKQKMRDVRAKMRSEEMVAIGEAVTILNDDDALDTFKKAAPGAALLEQPKTYDAFLQIQQSTSSNHAKRQSKETDAAEKLVENLIGGMIAVLHEEDVGDEHKKDWCANETEIVTKLEHEKKGLLQKTSNEIEDQEDQTETLASEIKALVAKIGELDSMVHEMTETRKKEHQEFVDSYATSVTAVRLIGKAIKRLEKFYNPEQYARDKKAVEQRALKKAGMTLLQKRARQMQAAAETRQENALLPGGFDAFVQLSSRTQARTLLRSAEQSGVQPAEVPDTPMTYEKQESGGVIGLMHKFQTDLKTDMTEAETEEKFSAKDYVRMMTDAQESRAQDVKSMNEKKKSKASLDSKLVQNKELKAATEEELHHLELYMVQLETECSFIMRNFEVRHEGRVEEETGLESTKTIVVEGTPPSHREVEERYVEETSDEDVDKNFPGTPVSDIPAPPS